MEIGLFKAAFDGYAGQIQFIGQAPVAVAIVPTENGGVFSVLLAGKGEEMSLKIGSARLGRKKSSLAVTLDSPLLKAPVLAEMELKANREGVYILKWER